MDKYFVGIIGAALIGLIYWFFFGKKESSFAKASEGQGGFDEVDVLVDGGYKPSIIKVRKGKKTTINLCRIDPSSCLEEFVLPDFKIKQYLPLEKTVKVEIFPQKAGIYPFHCGMNMFHGKVVVS